MAVNMTHPETPVDGGWYKYLGTYPSVPVALRTWGINKAVGGDNGGYAAVVLRMGDAIQAVHCPSICLHLSIYQPSGHASFIQPQITAMLNELNLPGPLAVHSKTQSRLFSGPGTRPLWRGRCGEYGQWVQWVVGGCQDGASWAVVAAPFLRATRRDSLPLPCHAMPCSCPCSSGRADIIRDARWVNIACHAHVARKHVVMSLGSLASHLLPPGGSHHNMGFVEITIINDMPCRLPSSLRRFLSWPRRSQWASFLWGEPGRPRSRRLTLAVRSAVLCCALCLSTAYR